MNLTLPRNILPPFPAKSLLVLTLTLAHSACSGSVATPKAKSASAESPSEGAAATDDEEYFDVTKDQTRTHEAPESCADGSCVKCGDAVCLPGLFCEESKSACGWIPQCARNFNCDCLQREMSGCSCEEKSGGIYLSCE
jgi:hypothetical protein